MSLLLYNPTVSIGYSFAANTPNNTAIFTVPQGKQYHINIGMLGMDGQLHDLRILADTGNDITLIRRETAEDLLGINPDVIPDSSAFPVLGITDTPVIAKEITNLIQFQDLRPVWIRMGVVAQRGIFSEDLLGRKDILDNGLYEVVYDHDSVEFRERHMNVTSVDSSIPGYNEGMPSEIRESFRPIRNPVGGLGYGSNYNYTEQYLDGYSGLSI